MKNLLVSLAILLAVSSFQIRSKEQQADPLFSHAQVDDYQALGPQDDLNRTMIPVRKNIYLGNFTYNTSDTMYKLTWVRPTTFEYDDSHQELYAVDNNTIIISGGQIQVEVDFNWEVTPLGSSKASYSGSGLCRGYSDALEFSKQMRIQNTFEYNFHLVKVEEINFSRGKARPFKDIFLFYSPPPEKDKEIIEKMIISMPGFKTVNEVLEEQSNKVLEKSLAAEVAKDHFPNIQQKFIYSWNTY